MFGSLSRGPNGVLLVSNPLPTIQIDPPSTFIHTHSLVCTGGSLIGRCCCHGPTKSDKARSCCHTFIGDGGQIGGDIQQLLMLQYCCGHFHQQSESGQGSSNTPIHHLTRWSRPAINERRKEHDIARFEPAERVPPSSSMIPVRAP